MEQASSRLAWLTPIVCSNISATCRGRQNPQELSIAYN